MVQRGLQKPVAENGGGEMMRAFRELLALPFILVAFVTIGLSLLFGFLATLIEGPR